MLPISAIEDVALRSMKRAQLVALAKRCRIPRYSRLSKAQLLIALTPVPRTETAELPATYGTTRLTLMAIEPSRVYAYWEITPADCGKSQDGLGVARYPAWFLRFYEAAPGLPGGPAEEVCQDVAIDPSSGNWYVSLPAGISFCFAEIGLRGEESLFSPVCRSNTIEIPSAALAPPGESQWLRVEAPSFFPVKVEKADPALSGLRRSILAPGSLPSSPSVPPGSIPDHPCARIEES
jgi:hypothetical protein